MFDFEPITEINGKRASNCVGSFYNPEVREAHILG
jgi:hypothetical protein